MHTTLKKYVNGSAAALLVLTLAGSCADKPTTPGARLAGDWDYYVMLGAAPNGGFEARRRMGEEIAAIQKIQVGVKRNHPSASSASTSAAPAY